MWAAARTSKCAYTEHARLISMHRWIGRFLLLVMLFPAFGPLALARVSPAEGMHCMRRPLAAVRDQAAEPVMHCHHNMAQSALHSDESQVPSSQASEKQASDTSTVPQASLRSLDCCCGQNCDCCRNPKTSEWASPAATIFSFVSLLFEQAPVVPLIQWVSLLSTGPDSARAPPLT